MMRNSNNIFHKVVAGLIACSLVLSLTGFQQPQRAHATVDTIEIGPNVFQNTMNAVTNTLSTISLGSLKLKEFALDAIAFKLAKQVLRQITQETVRWINSGFQGSPMFITNLDQFLLNAADQIAGEFIYGTELGFLCSPINIRISLALYYQKSRSTYQAPRCTLSGIVNNVENFLNGDFMSGGWPGFLALTLKPTNNTLGALFEAQAELDIAISNGKNRETIQINWGKGFLSKKECQTLNGKTACTIVTPGDTIAEALTFDLSTGKRSLIEADEINEIISALFAQLAQQALTGAYGLLGLTQTGTVGNTDFGNTSYIDQIGGPTDTTVGGIETNTAVEVIGEAIDSENAFQNLYISVANNADGVIGAATAANAAGSCTINDGIITQANSIKTSALAQLGGSISNISTLEDIRDRYLLATEPQDQLDIFSEFTTLQASGTLNDPVSNARTQFETQSIQQTLSALNGQVQQCPSGTGTNGGSFIINEPTG